MSRNFTSDQELTDRLYFGDPEALEELYHRYWFNLYTYSLKKLRSPEDAKHIVRDIFVDLWKKRESWPLDFSVARHFYTEVRKAVIITMSQKLTAGNDPDMADEIILGFSTEALQLARMPVMRKYDDTGSLYSNNASSEIKDQQPVQKKGRKYNTLPNIKWLFHLLTAKLN